MYQDGIFEILSEIMKHSFIRAHSSLRKYNIYPGQAMVLFTLNEKDGQSQKELCESLKVRPATITVMLKRMEKSELIIRKSDEKDKRVTRIYILEKAKDICKELEAIHKKFEKEMLINLSVEEKVILKRLLFQVRDNLRESSNNICCNKHHDSNIK